MKNITTFETAKKLEAAGLERPMPEIGQFWYDTNSNMHLITQISGIRRMFTRAKEGNMFHSEKVVYENEYQNWIYAPTATDLLEQLDSVWLAKDIGGLWRCFKIGTTTMVGYSANAAEAVAEAFLSQSKQ